MRFFSATRALRGVEPSGPIPSERELIRTTVRVAWPSMVESFLVSLVSIVDTMMVGTLGSFAIAAVGLTTQPKFLALAVFLSLNVAISALVARRRGEDDRDGANRVLRQILIIVVVLTAVVSLLCVAFAEPILWLAGAASDTHADASGYFRIIMGGLCFGTVSLAINAAQRGAGNTKIALRTNMVSNLVNVVFNYLLIGGNFGFPRLGVKGAAVATVLGTVCACVMSLYSVSHPHGFLFLFERRQSAFDRATLRSIINIGSSTLAEQVFMRVGFLVYALIVASLGTVAFAAHQIGMNMMQLSFSFGEGLSFAAVALIGQSLGGCRPDLARIYGSICQRIGLLCSLGVSVLFTTMSLRMFSLFTDDPAALAYGPMIMSLLSIITFLQVGQVVFSGCLRGAGDTVYIAVISLVSVTFIRPFCGWLFCYPLGMGLIGAWVGLAVDQSARFLMTYGRFRSGKWTRIKI